MSLSALEMVTQLAEQLSLDEQRSLVNRLRTRISESEMDSETWFALLESAVVNVAPGASFSDRRADWYGEDGR